MPINPALSAFVNILIQNLIPVAVTIILGVLAVKLYGPAKTYFEANVTAADQAVIAAVFARIVRAAEASKLKAQIEGNAWGAAEWAIKTAGDELARYGIDLDEESIIAGLRAALLDYLATAPPLIELPDGPAARGVTPSRNPARELAARLWV